MSNEYKILFIVFGVLLHRTRHDIIDGSCTVRNSNTYIHTICICPMWENMSNFSICKYQIPCNACFIVFWTIHVGEWLAYGLPFHGVDIMLSRFYVVGDSVNRYGVPIWLECVCKDFPFDNVHYKRQ